MGYYLLTYGAYAIVALTASTKLFRSKRFQLSLSRCLSVFSSNVGRVGSTSTSSR